MEKGKKKKYCQPCMKQSQTVVPFVVFVDRVIRKVRGLVSSYKQLSLYLADKLKKPISVVAGII